MASILDPLFVEQDTFLLSKMSKDHYVDLSVIAEFKMIKQLTSDVDLILKSIKDSDKVLVFPCGIYFAKFGFWQIYNLPCRWSSTKRGNV